MLHRREEHDVVSEMRTPAIEEVPKTFAEAMALVDRYRTEAIELKIMLDATEQYTNVLAKADVGERVARVELDKAQRQLLAERTVADKLRAQIAQLESTSAQLRAQAERERAEVGEVRAQLSAAAHAADDARNQLASALRAADEVQAQLADVADQLSAANDRCELLDVELVALRDERDSLQQTLASQAEDSAAVRELADLQVRHDELQAEITTLRAAADRQAPAVADESLQLAVQQLEADLAAQQSVSEDLRGLLAERDEEIERLTTLLEGNPLLPVVRPQARKSGDVGPEESPRIAALEQALRNEMELRADLQKELDASRQSERTAVLDLKTVQQELYLLQTRSSMLANRVAQAEQERDKIARAREADTSKRGFFSRLRRTEGEPAPTKS